RRISCVGIEDVRIDRPADPNQMFDEFGHAANAEPAYHRARDLVANQITEYGRMTAISADRIADGLYDFFARRLLSQKLNVFRPWQRDHHPHACRRALIQEPAGRWMINTEQINANFPHQGEVDCELLRFAEIIAFRIRLERAVGHTFD